MIIPIKVQEIIAEAAENPKAVVSLTSTDDGYAFLIRYSGSYKGLTIISFLPNVSGYDIVYLSGGAMDALKTLL